MADIEQMFYQIYVRSKDQEALLFFWLDYPFLPVSEFFYVRSPIQKNGLSMLCQLDPKMDPSDRVNYYPKRIIDAVLTRFHMDDYLDSFSNKEEAINVSTKVKQLLSNGGFNLTKFSSNNHNTLKSLSSRDTVN